MSKYYVSEQELKEIYDSQFADKDWNNKPWVSDFQDWVVQMLEEGKIELIEFSNYEVSKLDYKPVAKLVGANSNIFNLMGIAGKVLIEAGKEEKEKEMCKRISSEAGCYDEALFIIMEYVEVE